MWVTILAMGLSAPMIETAQGFTGCDLAVANVQAHEMDMTAALAGRVCVSIVRALRTAGDNERTE